MVETTECYQGRGEGYRGTVDVMPTGLICQRWDSQYPHNHTFTPQAYPCKWVGLSQKTAPPLARPPARTCILSRSLDDYSPCLPGTWERTTVGIQMAENSRGASLRTQESKPCSAPTSRSAAPKTIQSVVRDSKALFHTQEERDDFQWIPLVYVFIFCRRVHMRPCEY